MLLFLQGAPGERGLDLYSIALGERLSTGSGNSTPSARGAILQYGNCVAVGGCNEAMSSFSAALCAIRAQAEELQRQSVAWAIYDAARLSDRVKAAELLAAIIAVFPWVESSRFIYTSGGDAATLARVLRDGLRLERQNARPMDEDPGFADFPYNIVRWPASDIDQIHTSSLAARSRVTGLWP